VSVTCTEIRTGLEGKGIAPPNPAPAVATEIRALARASSHYLAGLLGKFGIGFISLPIFTRIFSIADYGLIDLAGKILLLLTALSKMGLQNSALRFFNGQTFSTDRTAERRYYSTMFYGALATSSLTAAAFLGVVHVLPASWLDAPLASLFGFVAVLLILRAMGSMLYSFLRIEEKTKAYNIWLVVGKAAILVAVCLSLPLVGRTARAFYWGSTAAELGVAAILTFFLLRRHVLKLSSCDFGLFWAGLLFGAPLILYEVSTILLDTAGRFLVRHYLGAESLGLYSVAYGLAAQTNDLLIFPLNLAILPIYLRLWRTRGATATIRFLSACLELFLMAAACVCAIATVTARDGIVFLASQKYHDAARLMPIIVVGLLIYTTHVFLCAGLLIQKKTGTMALVLLGSAIVNVAINCWLLPKIGLMAAALGTLISYAVCISLLAWVSQKYLPLRMPLYSLTKYVLAAVLAIGIGLTIDLRPIVLNLAVRSGVTALVYAAVLCALEPRVRRAVGSIWRQRGSSAGFVEAGTQLLSES
jgi:O-antigen/teichoic acid export membrane protein